MYVLSFARPAQADLGDEVTRLVQVWSKQAKVRRLAPRLVERGTPNAIFLPSDLLNGPSGSCVSVAVLATTSTHFMLRAVGGSHWVDPEEAFPQASLAGLLQFTRCGSKRSRLGTLLLELRSPRAVVEIVAATSAGPVEPALDVLPQRDPGPIAPFSGLRQTSAPAALSERLAAAEANARLLGAVESTRESIPNPPRGVGSSERPIEPGCYRWDLLGEPDPQHPAQAELTILPEFDDDTALVALDHGDGFAAAATFCTARRTLLRLRFAGAPANGRLWLISSRFELSEGLPEIWGPTGRARMAALLRHHGLRVQGTPVEQALGIAGPTWMPLRVLPGTCYVAAAVPLQGQAQGLALGVRVGGMSLQNRGPLNQGSALTFCTGRQDLVTVETDGRGLGLTWLFALWPSGRLRVGEEVTP